MRREVFVSNINSQPSTSEAWKGAMNNLNFRWQFITTLLVLSTFTFIFTHFFDFIEARSGRHLNDFILDNIPSYNVSWGVFFVLYTAIVVGLYTHRAHPKTVLIIREPLVQFFTNGGRIISKDLFFSGHVSTVMSVYLGTHLPKTRSFLFVCVVAICFLLLVQHVHYTIDVIFAVPATWLVFKFCKKFFGGK